MKKIKVFGFFMAAVMILSIFNTGVFKTEAFAAEDGLVLHLKFDGDLTDSSGEGNDATCSYGKVTYEDGVHGQSAVFNGKSYLEIADSDSLDLAKLTISLWVYKEAHINEYDRVPYVYKEKDEDHWQIPYRLYQFGDNIPILFMHGDNTNLDCYELRGEPTDIRKWFLLTVTYDGKEARMYENGVLLRKENITGAPSATLGNLYIGLDSDGNICFEGKMDDFRIYNRALSAKEVTALYEAGVEESPDLFTQQNALIAHYKFNGNLKDASEFGNNAKLSAGKITYIEGVNGKAAKFSKGTYLEVDDNTILDFDEGFSMTVWVKITADDIMTILNRPGVSTSGDPDDSNYRVNICGGYIHFEYTPFGYQTGLLRHAYFPEASIKNKWVHIGITYDTKEVCLYFNGKAVVKEKVSDYKGVHMAHGIGDLMIGSNGEFFFTGAMDELKIYNYKLTAKEVEADYKAVDSLSISKDNSSKITSLKKGNTVTLKVTRKYVETGKSSTITKDLTFKTSNSKVFTVSSKGVIKAVGKGTATLTITHGGISKTYKVTVK